MWWTCKSLLLKITLLSTKVKKVPFFIKMTINYIDDGEGGCGYFASTFLGDSHVGEIVMPKPSPTS